VNTSQPRGSNAAASLSDDRFLHFKVAHGIGAGDDIIFSGMNSSGCLQKQDRGVDFADEFRTTASTHEWLRPASFRRSG